MSTPQDERRGATSASNAYPDALCAGRYQAQRDIPEPPPSEDAAFGTIVHKALFDSGNREVMEGLTLEQRERFDQCREIEKKLMTQFFAGETDTASTKVFREQRFWCMVPQDAKNMAGLKFEHSGAPDVVFRRGQRALVLDYKTLQGDTPESPRNMQLRDLAVMVRGHLMVKEVGVAIIQPLVTMSPEICVYSESDLILAEQEMFDRVRTSNLPNAPRIAGEVQCKYCKAKSTCAEYQRFAPSVMPATIINLARPVDLWTPEDRTYFCERVGVAAKWLEDCKEQMRELLAKDPESIPGWTLEEGDKKESITDPQQVFARFAGMGGSQDQFLNCVSVGKGKLKEQLNQVTGSKGKALNEILKTLLEGLVEVKQNRPSLKRKE